MLWFWDISVYDGDFWVSLSVGCRNIGLVVFGGLGWLWYGW